MKKSKKRVRAVGIAYISFGGESLFYTRISP